MAGRITFRTAGSFMLLASAATSLSGLAALAADVTVTDTRTTPVSTATVDGSAPGNLTVDTAGAVNVTTATAVTINSNNTVTNNGTIASTQATGATGILVDLSQNRTSTITSAGAIFVVGPTDTASTTVANNAGIRLTGPGTYTGDISLFAGTTQGLTVGGASSYGLLSQSHIIGNINNTSAITTVGINSYGIATTGLLTGAITNLGSINAVGTNNVGLYVGGGMDGAITNLGTIGAGTGPQLVPDKTGTRLITSAPVNGRASVWLASNISGGFKNEGNGFTISQQTASADAAAALPADGFVVIIGPSAAINVAPGGLAAPQNFVVGPFQPDGYGIVNKGVITAQGAANEVSALGINIEGLTVGTTNYTARVEGFLNAGGDVQVQAQDATGTGLHIGNYGTLTKFVNTGDFIVTTIDSTLNETTNTLGTKGGSGYAIVVDALGALPSFTNSGNILVNVQGGNSGAYGIIDKSGTLTSFTNSGNITMKRPDGSFGIGRALDLSASSAGLTFNNTGTITGDLLLGGGNSTFTMATNGKIVGNVTFQAGATKTGDNTISLNAATITGRLGLGNGTHSLSLANNSVLGGGLSQGTGTLTLSVNQSQLSVTDKQTLNITNATFGTGSKLTFLISGTGPTTVMSAPTGTISFAAGTTITAAYDGILTSDRTITLIRAASLTFGSPLSQTLVAPTSFLNVATFGLDPTNSNALRLTVHPKTATELNLGRNMTALYGAFATALNKDTAVATSVSNQASEAATKQAFQKLLPDTSGATLQGALDNNEMASGMIRRRLTAVAKNGVPEHTLGDVSGFWAQALGDFETQNARGEQAGFSLWGLGIGVGVDFPVQDHTIIGLSLMESWHSADLQINKTSPVQFYTSQANLYTHSQLGPFYVQAIAGAALNSYDQARKVVLDATTRTAESSWKGYQFNGALELGYGMFLGKYKLSPYARAGYVKLHENDYSETGGGDGINLNIGDKDPESLRGSLGFTLDRAFPIFYDSYVEGEVRGDFTREFKTAPFPVIASFVAGGPTFTNFSNTPNKNTFGVGLGVSHKDSYSSVSLDYDARIASGYLSHQASVTVRFRF